MVKKIAVAAYIVAVLITKVYPAYVMAAIPEENGKAVSVIAKSGGPIINITAHKDITARDTVKVVSVSGVAITCFK